MDSFAQLVPELSLESLMALLPLALFLVAALVLSIVARSRAAKTGDGFVKSYFIGNRAMGGFVLAMTTIATYGSVSSFVGGPGQAWQTGFGWVYMSVVQVTALVLLYGIIGKKMALISRKIDAITVVDVIRARYGSNVLANASAIIIVVFFMAIMVAQFVGGAKLFEAVTGYSYVVGLVLFGIAVVLFTTIGGFRGVAVTDTLCGIAMLVGIGVLAFGILHAGGGYEGIMNYISEHSPAMLEPFADGSMPPSLYFTQWLLVGALTFVLPQSVVRTMGYKDVKSLHTAMIWGTVIIGAMMIGVTTLGVLSAGVLTRDLASYGGSVDNIIPAIIVQSLPPAVAGIAIIGPVAASISTVSSLLISSSSAIVKDIFLSACDRLNVKPRDSKVAAWSQFFTFGIGILVFVLSVVPPDIIWKINMFAFGGLETAFFFVLVGGLFWKKANATGACWSMIAGTVAYCASMAIGFRVAELHQIVIGIVIAGYFMILGSLIGRQKSGAQLDVFFPSATSEQKVTALASGRMGSGAPAPASSAATLGAPAPASVGAAASAPLPAGAPAPATSPAPGMAAALAAASAAPAAPASVTGMTPAPAPALASRPGRSGAPLPAPAGSAASMRGSMASPAPAPAAAAPATAAPLPAAMAAAPGFSALAPMSAPAAAPGSYGAPLPQNAPGAYAQQAPTNPYAAASNALRESANPYSASSTLPATVPSPLAPPMPTPEPPLGTAPSWGAHSGAYPSTMGALGSSNPYDAASPYAPSANMTAYSASNPINQASMMNGYGNFSGNAMGSSAPMGGSSSMPMTSLGTPPRNPYLRSTQGAYQGVGQGTVPGIGQNMGQGTAPGMGQNMGQGTVPGMGQSIGQGAGQGMGQRMGQGASSSGYSSGYASGYPSASSVARTNTPPMPYGSSYSSGSAPYRPSNFNGSAGSYSTSTPYGNAGTYGQTPSFYSAGTYGAPSASTMGYSGYSYGTPPRPAAPSTPYVPGGPQYGYGSTLPGTSPLSSPMLSGPPSQFQMPPDGYSFSRSQQRALRQEAKAARRARGQY